MATNEVRYCMFCDAPVKEVTGEIRSVGNGPKLPYVHAKPTSCPRQGLTEDQTYTMGDSDLNPPS